jgi:hypothetical protein
VTYVPVPQAGLDGLQVGTDRPSPEATLFDVRYDVRARGDNDLVPGRLRCSSKRQHRQPMADERVATQQNAHTSQPQISVSTLKYNRNRRTWPHRSVKCAPCLEAKIPLFIR